MVGPNGAGKTTFVEHLVAPAAAMSVSVNADLIAAQRWPDDPAGHAYEAAAVAEATRLALIERGQPLIAETVCSHPSKLALIDVAHGHGYFVAVHALMVPVSLAVARTELRARTGGHSVPEAKVRTRYERLWPIVATAATRADTATFWDNSGLDGPVEIALLAAGQLIGRPVWPAWAPAELTARWPS